MERNFHPIISMALVIVLTCLYPLQANKFFKPVSPKYDRPENSPRLVYQGMTPISSSSWTKSVLLNSSATKLYTFNLEEMSINEIDCSLKVITKKFRFKKTASEGWDYDLNRAMPSFEEKPVEGCFSHNDKILWVSLHNAGGIVAIPMDSSTVLDAGSREFPTKTVYISEGENRTKDSLLVPFIKTGRTPKVIAVTVDNRFLLVSNWHSNTVSVIRINDTVPPYGKKITDIKTGVFPRGIAIGGSDKSYVANMGSDEISVVNNKSWKVIKNLQTGINPRHLVMGSDRFYVSYNTSSEIACINKLDNRILFRSSTSANPRTIALSNDQRFLFVACYEGNAIDVFEINDRSFAKIYSIDCSGKPIGIDLMENSESLEAWVCTYEGKSLKVFSFLKNEG